MDNFFVSEQLQKAKQKIKLKSLFLEEKSEEENLLRNKMF